MQIDWFEWISTIVIGLVLAYFRGWMAKEFKDIKECLKDKVSEKTCVERTTSCQTVNRDRARYFDEVNKELWDVVNSHGHKGFTGEENQVVRIKT